MGVGIETIFDIGREDEEPEKIGGIFCLNSKCRYYFEDNCIRIHETTTAHVSADGKCEDFEVGQHPGYVVQ